MVTTRFALFLCLLGAVLTLAWGYFEAGLEGFVRGWMGFGALWAFALIRRWTWFSAFGLFASLAVAAAGLWFGLAPGWMLAGALFALLAWDLTDFERRLRLAAEDDEDDDTSGMVRLHLTRLGLVALIGFTLASIAMLVRLQFSFEWAALMALVAALGLSQLIGWMRRGRK